MNIIILTLLICSWIHSGVCQFSQPLVLRSDDLEVVRAGINRRDVDFEDMTLLLSFLKRDAEKLLQIKPKSVMNKPTTPESGDKHDYLSFGLYWWPNPKTNDGLPYIRRDGKSNPEAQHQDTKSFQFTMRAVKNLGLAYWFIGDERYSQQAATLVRTWFLDPATKMNPHLAFAQRIPGRDISKRKSHGLGIIEARELYLMIDGLSLISRSPAWSANDSKELLTWFTSYYNWLQTSENAKSESEQKNNHGTWFDVQMCTVALALGCHDHVKKIVNEAKTKRISVQIEPDGKQPLELSRTNTLHYSLFNLEALIVLSRLGEHVGEDLWSFATPDGRGIQAALRYLSPYADTNITWSHSQDYKAAHRYRLYPMLTEAERHFNDKYLHALLEKHGRSPIEGEYWRLSSPAH